MRIEWDDGGGSGSCSKYFCVGVDKDVSDIMFDNLYHGGCNICALLFYMWNTMCWAFFSNT